MHGDEPLSAETWSLTVSGALRRCYSDVNGAAAAVFRELRNQHQSKPNQRPLAGEQVASEAKPAKGL